MINKEKTYAIAKLWRAGALLMALCLATDLYAQEPAAVPVEVAADTTDVIAEQANGINTVWMPFYFRTHTKI